MHIKLSGLLTIVLLGAIASPPSQGNVTTAPQIKQVAEDFVRAQLPATDNTKVEVTASKLDPRIKLKPCSAPLEPSLPGKTTVNRYTTVQVSCGNHWSIYVPVKVKQLKQVVVAAHNLGPGSLLDESALTLGYIDANQVRGEVVTDIARISGSKVKRHVQQGRPLLLNLICLVCKGDNVTIYARRGGLTIKSSGTALKDGTAGDSIRIKNTSSGRFINARVIAVGEVEVNF